MDHIVRRVRDTIKRQGLLAGGERLGVAVSGGGDSMVLLHAIHALAPELNLHPLALHVRHGLRPEAVHEEQAAQALALSLNLPFESLDAGLTMPLSSLEDRARQARYHVLTQAARRLNLDLIATGHTATDQAETLVMRLIRGTGLAGLTGIQPRRQDGFIRPLLDVTRQEARDYAVRHSLAFKDDPSNHDPRFGRTPIRHEVLPLLERLGPGATLHMAALAEEAALAERIMAAHFDAALKSVTLTAQRDRLALDAQALAHYGPPERDRLLRSALTRLLGHTLGFDRHHIRAMAALLDRPQPGKATRWINLPHGVLVSREYDTLVLRQGSVAEPSPLRVTGPGVLPFGPWTISLILCPPGQAPPQATLLDPIVASFPLDLRPPRPGDRLPLAGGGRKKLSRLLQEARIPRTERPYLPVLSREGVILWVGGLATRPHHTPEPRGPQALAVWADPHEREGP